MHVWCSSCSLDLSIRLTHRNDCEHINTSRLHSEKCRAYASGSCMSMARSVSWLRGLVAGRCVLSEDSYLVDPASSHMLVSKIKPCMSKYKHLILWNCEWLIKSVIVYLMISCYLDTRGNSRANTCDNTRLLEGWYLLDKKPSRFGDVPVIHNNFSKCMALRRRWFIQISALSTFDGRIEAYHGGNG